MIGMPSSFKNPVLFFVFLFVSVSTLFLGLYANTLISQNQRPIDPSSLAGEYVPSDTLAEFYGQNFFSPDLPTPPLAQVMGANDTPKRIEVDLSVQRLYAFEGDQKVYDFLISSGKWGKTPTGTFTIWGKFRYTKMEGGSKGTNTYYYLPNVPYVMFFSNDKIAASRGFSLHGTYWHENFGTPMSHGCVNMKTEEAGIIYNWVNPNLGDKKSGRASAENPGTQVTIYGVAPKN